MVRRCERYLDGPAAIVATARYQRWLSSRGSTWDNALLSVAPWPCGSACYYQHALYYQVIFTWILSNKLKIYKLYNRVKLHTLTCYQFCLVKQVIALLWIKLYRVSHKYPPPLTFKWLSIIKCAMTLVVEVGLILKVLFDITWSFAHPPQKGVVGEKSRIIKCTHIVWHLILKVTLRTNKLCA